MEAKKNRRRGKVAQKQISRLLNGLDIGILGKADVLSEYFIVEVKHRKKFIGENFLQEAEAYKEIYKKENKFEDKIPVAIVHVYKKQYKDSIVCIRLKDLLALIEGKVGKKDNLL